MGSESILIRGESSYLLGGKDVAPELGAEWQANVIRRREKRCKLG